MRVSIFGTGYVGLVSGACLAEAGNNVQCVDIDQHKIERLNAGEIPIYEPGLEDLVVRNRHNGSLRFTLDTNAAVDHAEVIFIAVGTPPDEDGSADLRYVEAVARAIGRYMTRYVVVVNKSTVPVGTADRVRRVIAEQLREREVQIEFDVVSNPEFLKEGDAVKDCIKPDRIVLGTRSATALELLKTLYAPFNRNHERVVVMDERSAELTKYAANAMLATKISFMNEIANIAERVGADVEMVRLGIGSDPRIGYAFIYPGTGYGGSCFPKDVQALERTAQQAGYAPRILQAVEAVNQDQKSKLYRTLQSRFGELRGLHFAIWGLSFKPNTDDMREAPSRVLMEALWAAGATVNAFDPEATSEAQRIYGERADLQLAADPYAALQDADALLIVTEWKTFWSPDLARIKAMLKHPVIIDGRNIYDPRAVEAAGLEYYGIGRGRSIQQPEAH
jgi:UDPglucose 6-dehydrogenase